MKKLIITFIALVAMCGTAQSQSWLDALKDVATTAIDEATGGKLTQMAIVGTWNYSGPGVKFEGEDIVSSLGGAALESSVTERLAKAYSAVGIAPGACTFTFNNDKTFTARLGKRELTGTYEFDSSSHLLTLNFTRGTYNIGSMPGHAYLSGTELQIVFPVTKLVDMITAIGSRVSSLSNVTKLLKKYENVYIGFEFSK